MESIMMLSVITKGLTPLTPAAWTVLRLVSQLLKLGGSNNDGPGERRRQVLSLQEGRLGSGPGGRTAEESTNGAEVPKRICRS